MRSFTKGMKGAVDRGPGSFVYLILLIQSLTASGTHLVAKVVAGSVEPFTLTLLRSLLAASALVGILFLRGRPISIQRGDYLRVGLLGVLAVPINQFLFLIGIKHTTPSNAALLYATTPLLVVVFSRLFLGEKLNRRKLLGVALGFIGVAIVILERGVEVSESYLKGNLIICVAVLAWGLYTVFGRDLIRKYGPIEAGCVTLIAGTLWFLPVGLWFALDFQFASMTANSWWQILYLALGTSVVSYLLWYYALGRVEAGKVALFANLQPVLTTLMAILFLGQAITAGFVIGGIVALAGVAVAQFG